MPRKPSQQVPTVAPANSARRGPFLPGKFGAWYEERLAEREVEKGQPFETRAGRWRSVSNGDFSEEEIRELERKYGARIKRP